MFSIFGRLCSIILFILFFRISDYYTTYIYIYIQQDKITIQKAVQWGTKEGKAENSQTTEDCLYGKPIWNTAAAQRSRPLQRDFPREAGAAKADAKLGSYIKDRLWRLAGGLETSNLRGNFTGFREIFLFLLVGEEWILLGPGGQKEGTATGTCSTRPSSTMSQILTPSLNAVSLRGLPPWYQRSFVSLAVRRRNTPYPNRHTDAFSSKQRINRLGIKCERIHKGRRKHYIVFHEWKQSKYTNTSTARCWSCVEEYVNWKS